MSRVVAVTAIELRSAWYYFRLTMFSMNIVRELKEFRCRKWKSNGFGRRHFVMTLWDDEAAVRHFMKTSQAHLRAMSAGARLATKVEVVTFPGDKLPDWRQAKSILLEKGRVLSFDKKAV